jgi:hypothetical protein
MGFCVLTMVIIIGGHVYRGSYDPIALARGVLACRVSAVHENVLLSQLDTCPLLCNLFAVHGEVPFLPSLIFHFRRPHLPTL